MSRGADPPGRRYYEPDRLKFIQDRITIDDNGCWVWQRVLHSNGYARFIERGKAHYAHRYVYEMVKGPIPAGLHIDHLCRNRACCNPDHLRAVTCRENLLAPGSQSPTKLRKEQTHCYRGHSLDDAIVSPSGTRRCRTCRNERRRVGFKEAS